MEKSSDEIMRQGQIEQIGVDLLLEAIYQRYGYDFRSYARASIERRIRQFLSNARIASPAQAIDRLLNDEAFFIQLIGYFSIAVTEMFRDPQVFAALRQKVVPLLKTWPHFKVWHAGCATGEEAYSLAIVLKEEGAYERATIYATDFNDAALARAREGIYPLGHMREATRNYQASGGTASFSDYYHADYEAAVMNSSLRQRIVFSNHNLVADGVFSEIHIVFCRNVLIYFNRELQNRVLRLFTDSLVHGGYLCLGTKEDLNFTEVASRYETVDARARIYKKVA